MRTGARPLRLGRSPLAHFVGREDAHGPALAGELRPCGRPRTDGGTPAAPDEELDGRTRDRVREVS